MLRIIKYVRIFANQKIASLFLIKIDIKNINTIFFIIMTSIEIHKIAQLYDYKMKLTNGMKNYTYDKARDFAVKFCDKNFSIYEEDIVKSLISKNILTRFDLWFVVIQKCA